MAGTIVLVHSPLVGPGIWRKLAPELSKRDWQVIVPDLRTVMSGGGPYYPKLADFVVNELFVAGRAPLTLLVHSGAGALVPLISRAGSIVGRAIFLDAILPHPRKSWRDTVPVTLWQQLAARCRDGVIPPWLEWWPKGAIESLLQDPLDLEALKTELFQLPLAYFDEPAPDVEIPADVACSYLQISDAYAGVAAIARTFGWPVQTIALNHVAMLTHPRELADAIQTPVESAEA